MSTPVRLLHRDALPCSLRRERQGRPRTTPREGGTYKYITGIVAAKGQKLLSIYGMADHLHLLVGTRLTMVHSDLVRDIKASSSRFTREKGLVRGTFEWQDGFGALTLGHSLLSKIIPYIQNQEAHHRVHTFREEYIAFLQRYEADYKPGHLFQEVSQAISHAGGCSTVYTWRSYGALIPFPTRVL